MKMELAFGLDGCPLAWQNFITWLQKESNNFHRDVAMNIIQRELKKFNAEYIEHHPEYYVSFDTEQDYTWFTLRWS